MKADRISCEVPFCRRTAPKSRFGEGVRIICGKHSRLADDRIRRIYKLARRRLNKNPEDFSAERVMGRMWDRMRAQAIERAAGIT